MPMVELRDWVKKIFEERAAEAKQIEKIDIIQSLSQLPFIGYVVEALDPNKKQS